MNDPPQSPRPFSKESEPQKEVSPEPVQSPMEGISNLDEQLAVILNDIEAQEKRKEEERIQAIKENWEEKGMPRPEMWPRLKLIDNYDEDPAIQKNLRLVEEDFRKFKKSRTKCGDKAGSSTITSEEVEAIEEELREAERVIRECNSEDDRFEASELVEYRNHDWCIALRIEREKTYSTTGFELLVYSYKRGIERLPLTSQEIDALGTSLLIKYKKNKDDSIECLPIYSSLPSSGLVGLKYRMNRGVELRVYGIANFVDFVRDPDYKNQMTMVWTDSIGPIYLSEEDRKKIQRRLSIKQSRIFAPLRMCQLNIKGEFKSNVSNGTILKWEVVSFKPMFEETLKDPYIGRNLWPARIIRMDDLVFKTKILSRDCNQYRDQLKYLQSNSGGGTLLTSHSNSELRVFCGPHLTGILKSAGEKYYKTGVMTAFIVPYYQNGEFSFYEALIAGPARVVMLITEGRFLNYAPKTGTPSMQRLRDEEKKVAKAVEKSKEKPQIRPPPLNNRSHPEDRIKSFLGFKEMSFDF